MPSVSIHKDVLLSNVERAKEIFEEHGDFIRSIISFKVGSETIAEDLFQDLFLALILKPVPRGVQNIKGFLYRLISDNIKDAVRRIDYYKERLYRYSKYRICIIQHRPEHNLMEMEEARKMFRLIEKYLAKKEAMAVKLRYGYDYDTAEIANRMGVETRTVSRYVSVGLSKIRQVLCQQGKEQL